jgi:uncharacterized membrane protein YeiB
MTDRDHGPASAQGPGALMADVLAGVSRLVQGELALARAEAAERLQSAKKSVLQGVVAVVLGVTAINLLAAALVATIVAMGLSPIWASLLVGVVLLLVALASAQKAVRLLRDAGKAPRRTAASVRRDVETLQTMVRRDATS